MSNTLPENNLSALPIPGYDAFGAASITTTAPTGPTITGGGNLGSTHADISLNSPCATHKVASNSGKFPKLNNVAANQKIWAAEINSLKWAIKNVGDFWNQTGNGQLKNTVPTFTTKTAGNLITTSEWNEIKNTLSAFTGVQGATALTYRGTSDRISATFHNDLAMVYEGIRNTCRCNSDCGCNLVCTCNYNCGCNYSDRRLKTNIIPITGESTSELIYDLNTYSYNYIYDREYQLPSTLQYGVMAQDLIELGYHEFISLDKLGHYKVNYTMMTPLIINEMQKMRRKNNDLEDRLQKLELIVEHIYSNYKSY